MKIKKLILVACCFAEMSFAAINQWSIIAPNLIKNDMPFLYNFDGKGFYQLGKGYYSPTAIKSIVEEGSGAGTANYDLKKNQLKITTDKYQFTVDGVTEEFENGADRRVNQTSYDKVTKKVRTSSMTFNGNHLRSITTCEGIYANKVYNKTLNLQRDNLKTTCATATPKVCQNVLNAYNQQASGNEQLKSGEEMKEKVNSCVKVMDGYAKSLQAYSAINAQVSNNYAEIIKTEEKQVKEQLGQIKEFNSTWDYLNSISNKDEFAKLSDQLTSSMEGMNRVHNLIRLCQNNIEEFNPTSFDKNLPVPAGKPPTKTVK